MPQTPRGTNGKTGILAKMGHELHSHFIPSERNGHVPHVLKHHVLFGYSLVLILVKVFLLAGYTLLPASSVYSSAVTSANVIELTNAARASAGLDELAANASLSRAATAKAEDMVINQYFAHKSPAGRTPWSWIKETGYAYTVAAENLAVHYTSAEGLFDGWMASPSHKKNIVDSRFTEIGVGIARGTYQGYETTFVVQMFGLPKTTVAVAPAPAPAPVPEPVPEPEPEAKIVAEVVPQKETLIVRAVAAEATAVTAQVAGNVTPLAQESSSSPVWTGTLPAQESEIAAAGETVYVQAQTPEGPIVEPVAVVSPKANVQQFYLQDGNARSVKLFGAFRIDSLEDSTRRFYVLMTAFLAGALLISLLVRFEMRRHGVTLHAVLVIGLSLVLRFVI